jgi:hypothetical protein
VKSAQQIMGARGLYDKDIYIVKKQGHELKVIYLKSCRRAGLEDICEYSAKNSMNSIKLENNISRARSRIKEYALQNEWHSFATLTLNKEKYDRYDLKNYHKDLSKFINNYNRSLPDDEKVKYLLIPEMHKDGAWHMHGLLKGIQKQDMITNSNGYQTWIQYQKKFGYISFSPINDISSCSNYILKYIGKGFGVDVQSLGSHLYYSSKGLARADIKYKGFNLRLLCAWDYESEDGFCKIKTIDLRYQNPSDYLELLE